MGYMYYAMEMAKCYSFFSVSMQARNSHLQCRSQINEIFSYSYIAAQGPNDETIGLFWEMAWQKNVRVIVMLTNLIEGLGFNANKCSQYWPDMVGSSRFYQDIHVQLYDRQEAPDYLGRYESWRFLKKIVVI